MPVSPALAEGLASVLGDLYRAAEYVLIDTIKRTLATGMSLPNWAESKLAALGDLSSALAGIAEALAGETAGTVGEALSTAYDRGQQAAVAELSAVAVGQAAVVASVLPTAPVVDRLAASVLDTLTPVRTAILRQTQDVYRSVIAQAAAAPALGAETRRQATQRALDAFVDRGIVNFVDTRGRAWGMAEYAEMALRTAVGRAAIEAHSDRLGAARVPMVMVSDQPLHCPRCDKWAGKILWRSGAATAGTVMVEHATEDGKWATVKVAGSLPEARAAGLLHPNCRCSIAAYLPGVSTPPESVPHPAGATYADTQRQRALERQVRKWRKREAAALDEDTAKVARRKVAESQTKLRELTGAKGLKRKPEREKPSAGRPGRGGPSARPADPTPRPPAPPSAPAARPPVQAPRPTAAPTPMPRPQPRPQTSPPAAITPQPRPTPTPHAATAPTATPSAPAHAVDDPASNRRPAGEFAVSVRTEDLPRRAALTKVPPLTPDARELVRTKSGERLPYRTVGIHGRARDQALDALYARGWIDEVGVVTDAGRAQALAYSERHSMHKPIPDVDPPPPARPPRMGRRYEDPALMNWRELDAEWLYRRGQLKAKTPGVAAAADKRMKALSLARLRAQLGDDFSSGS
ncbi:phage minor capsid protein [Embleya scabrispora]|uniref:phage minor capsid protein n=1 Tax=Embleya scabrispora TaxID=159449 RepID=UPI000C7A6829|nr:phage minor capsid protein [Embleya scabrispora]